MLMFIVLLILSLYIYFNIGFLLGSYLWKIAHQAPTNFRQGFFDCTFFARSDPYKQYKSYETKPCILTWSQGQYAGTMSFGWGPMIIAHIILYCLIIIITVVINLGSLILNLITWPVRKTFKLKLIPYFNPFN